jgi:hypothetical protein
MVNIDGGGGGGCMANKSAKLKKCLRTFITVYILGLPRHHSDKIMKLQAAFFARVQLFQHHLQVSLQHVSCVQICKRLRSPGIEPKESITTAYVAWRVGTTNRVIV